MTESSLFCLNLKSSGGWKIETNKHQQIIALTTQLNEMETKLAKLTPKVGGTTLPKMTTADTSEMKGRFSLWRLQKVPSSKEHCMIERDGAKWYWCEDGHSFENKPYGMYCIHKLGDGHIAWLARKKSTNKPMLRRRVMLPLLRLSHYHPLHQRLLPNLTLVICQSFIFQSLFSQQ